MQHDVIKVGGSLLTVPDIAKSLEAFLNNMPVSCKVIVVGGGIPVRKLEAESPGFSPEEEHWASLRIMTENAISLRSHFTMYAPTVLPYGSPNDLDLTACIYLNHWTRQKLLIGRMGRKKIMLTIIFQHLSRIRLISL